VVNQLAAAQTLSTVRFWDEKSAWLCPESTVI
jgi:hypothetical protein